METGEEPISTWGQGSSAPREVRDNEQGLEKRVSQTIRNMPLWLAINDDPGPDSLRGYIECNAISLLSNYNKPAIDTPSEQWPGHSCNREKVRGAGLWNQNYVEQAYDPIFLDMLEKQVSDITERR